MIDVTLAEVAGTLHPFDDRAVLREALARCAGRSGAETMTELARSGESTGSRSTGSAGAGGDTP